MRLIVITPSESIKQEHQLCAALLEAGLQTLHVRKPAASINDLHNWLQQLPPYFHRHLMLHSYHELAQEFEVKGLHFTERSRADAATTQKGNLLLSTSFHRLQEVQQPNLYFDYAFLSPVFQSISKEEYPAAFSQEELVQVIPEAIVPLVALGGITAARLPEVQQLGFAGAAVLGAVWESTDPLEAFKKFQQVAQTPHSA